MKKVEVQVRVYKMNSWESETAQLTIEFPDEETARSIMTGEALSTMAGTLYSTAQAKLKNEE